MGPILRQVTVCRGLFGLHAGGVAYGRDAILVVGSQGAGKSTLLATLGALGGSIFADDLTVLTGEGGQWAACSGAREVKLTADALAAAGSRPGATARPQWDLSRVALPPGETPKFVLRTADDPIATRYRLIGIHILGTRSSDIRASSLARLGKAAATAQLARHLPSVAPELAHLRQAAVAASMLAGVASAIPVWTVSRPDDLSSVRATARAVLETLRP
jgi:ABC-type cobalamin/Fe3+-siderophores transport system ATPase subunit